MQMVEIWHLCCRDWHSSTSWETVMRTSQVIPDQTSPFSWPDPSPQAFLSLSPSHSYPHLVAMTIKETLPFRFFSHSLEAFPCSVHCPIHLPLSSIPDFKLHPFRPLSPLPCLLHAIPVFQATLLPELASYYPHPSESFLLALSLLPL